MLKRKDARSRGLTLPGAGTCVWTGVYWILLDSKGERGKFVLILLSFKSFWCASLRLCMRKVIYVYGSWAYVSSVCVCV